MTMPLPPRWASNTNYSAGPDTGSATKVDPASQANGYIRGVAAAAQTVNFVINPLADAARRSFLLAACKLHRITLEGTAITDTAESMGAVQRNIGTPLVAIKTAQAFGLGDSDRFNAQGVPASVTSLIADAATNGTRIGAIGTGGNRCTYSDDDGATWTAGNDTTVVQARIIWVAFLSKFLVNAINSVRRSPDIATAWTNSVSLTAAASGLAASTSGGGIVVGMSEASATPAFRSSADAAIWGATAGTVANAGSFDEKGTIDGNEGALIYHCGRLNTGATIQVSASPDGGSWSTTASIAAPGGASFSSSPRIMMCPNTGLLVIAAPTSSNQTALYASLDGADWVGPALVFPNPGVNAFALAGGRVLMTQDDMLFASDGVGF